MFNSYESSVSKNIENQTVSAVEKSVPIEQQANFKGNYTELVFSRLQNPVIKKQLLDLYENNERWLSENPPTVSEIKKNKITGEIMYDDLGLPIFESVPGVYIPKTREQLESSIDEALEREMSVTAIDFTIEPLDSVGTTLDEKLSSEGFSFDIYDPKNRTVNMGVKRESTEPLSENEIRNRSLSESHEKGHVFRHFQGSGYLENKFSQCFDVTKINPDTYFGAAGKPEGATNQEVIDSAKEYLFNFRSPHEIIERMSQLKSYFGMKGDEKFTSQHLEYARKHYLKDGMIDNNMTTFFEAITPETEFAFLKLINSVGV